MKKLLSVILTFMLLGSIALAENIDLTGLSFDELVALKDRINMAIWECDEWQEVTVPIGVWVVGKDIPVGHWTIKAAPGCEMSWGSISYGTKLDEVGKKVTYDSDGFNYYEQLKVEGSSASVNLTEIDLDLQRDGAYIVIDECDMIFSPFIGKPALGFK